MVLDWLQSLKQFFINLSYNILVASQTLMALFKNRAIRVRLATSILIYDTLMKNCFKDWSQSSMVCTLKFAYFQIKGKMAHHVTVTLAAAILVSLYHI